MSALSHLAVLSSAFFLALAGYMLLVDRRSGVNRAFAALSVALAVWTGAFAGQLASSELRAAWTWYRVGSVGWTLGPALLLLFLLELADQGRLGRAHRLAAGGALVAGLAFLVRSATGIVYGHTLVAEPGGWVEQVDFTHPWTVAYLAYVVLSAGYGGAVVAHWGMAAPRGSRERAQAVIVVVASVAVIASGLVSNGVLLALESPVPGGMAPLIMAPWGLAILYAVIRYRLMAISPGVAAEEIVRTLPDALLLLDPDLRVSQANPAARELLTRASRLEGQDLEHVLWGADPTLLGDLRDTLLHEPVIGLELSCVGPGPRPLPLRLDSSPVRSGTGAPMGVVLVIRDLRLQRELEAELRHSQELDMVGRLAAHVAHDFNNLLTAIVDSAEEVRDESPEFGAARRAAGTILEAARRGSTLTEELIGFARQGKYRVARVDMHGLVRQAVERVRPILEVRVTAVLEAGRCAVDGDPSQLLQVLLRLLLRAGSSAPDRRALRVATSVVSLPPVDVEPGRTLVAGDYLLVEVGPEGQVPSRGEDPEALDPGGPPDPARELGLGLAMAWGVVRNHDGVLSAGSGGDHGTFSIRLPLSRELERERPPREPGAESREAPAAGADPGRPLALVVDDERLVRRALSRMLGSLGYEVVQAPDGEQALERLARGRRFDLVVLDLVMPGMSGDECLDRILDRDPGARVLLCSGYADESRAQGALKRGAAGFVTKPCELDVLREAVEAAVSGRP